MLRGEQHRKNRILFIGAFCLVRVVLDSFDCDIFSHQSDILTAINNFCPVILNIYFMNHKRIAPYIGVLLCTVM